MPKPPIQASAPSAAGDDRNLVVVDDNYLAPSAEDRLLLFWSKHSKSIIAVVVIVFLAVIANGAYGFFKTQHEKAAAVAYAAAKTDDQLKTFITDYPSLPVTGLAQLRLADDSYAAGNFTAAQAGYTQAASSLGNTTFGQRARLGAAVSLFQSGKATEGEAALTQIFSDTTFSKAIRAEAGYHLASLAADAGKIDEVTALIAQLSAIDPEGQWAERALVLQARLPVASTPAAAPTVVPSAAKPAAAPAVNFKTTPAR